MVGAVFQDFSFPALPQEVQLGSENPFNTNSASIIGCGISALDAEISECLLELQHDRRSRLPKSWMSYGPEATRPGPSWTALEDANKVTTPTLASADDKIPALQDIHGVGTLPQSSSPIQSPSLGKSSPSTATSGSEQSTSFEDSTDDEYSIERSTEEALSQLSRHTPVILRLALQRFAQWRNGGHRLAGSGNNRSRGASPPSNSTGDEAGRLKRSKQQATRRKRIEDGEGTGSGADDDEEDRSRGNKKARLDTTEEDKTPLFACPFYKHDIGKHHKCLSFTLRRIKDVKQHLLRRHLQPPFCITCGEVFESQEAQEAHLLARSCTRPEDFSRPEGITTDQRNKLTTRVSKTLSADQQWFSVWRIIWPDAEPPVSPYVSTAFVEVIDEVRKFWSSHGREIIAEQLNTADTPYGLPAEERLLASLFLNCGQRIMQMFTDRLGARAKGPSISGREGNLPADADRASSTGAVGSQTSMPGLTSEEGSDPLQEPPEHPAQNIHHDLIHAPQGLDCAQWSADMAPHTRGLVPIDADSQEFSTSFPELHSLYPEVYTNGAGEEIPFINMDVENSVEFDKAMLAFDDMLGEALSSHDPQPKGSSHTNRHEVLGGHTQQLDSWPWSS
ncbi:hypothetical protein Micbo1qcDRAFT_233236 [Microdochium bolleyi]|uniref:C2H2-type domain-containing protein n=1 Tax=Microdochium bolleyi TaxID=196109 RepID=A0A136J432_9PEZI|nr:hypothetical protein Micbo1qcDRAFT_233236 [Microdochium bolleyi]